MISPPPLPNGYYLVVKPGHYDWTLGDIEICPASVTLFREGFWDNTMIVTVDIPDTTPKKHPTPEQVLKAMETAALYVEYR